MTKIKYNKDKSGRILIGGGPRDIQLRQQLLQAEMIKRAVDDSKSNKTNKESTIDLSQYLPLSEVKEKIDSAVEFTKKNERDKLIAKDLEITELKSELSIKEEIYMNLQLKMDRIYECISNGSINSLIGSKVGRPALEDKIFIDPLEKDADTHLDSHINIEEYKASEKTSERDIKTDLNKLRSLLKS